MLMLRLRILLLSPGPTPTPFPSSVGASLIRSGLALPPELALEPAQTRRSISWGEEGVKDIKRMHEVVRESKTRQKHQTDVIRLQAQKEECVLCCCCSLISSVPVCILAICLR